MANNIAVSITADVVDLQAKRAVMSAELKAATKDLNAFAKEAASTGATDELRAGMLSSAEAAEKARAKIALVTQEIKDLNKAPEPSKHGFEGVNASISETGVHLRESLGLFTEFRGALMEVAEVVMIAFAVEKIAEWASEMGEAAEKTKQLAETFGMTVSEVQGLDAIAKASGMDFDALAKGMGVLDKNTASAGEGSGKAATALKAVGVSASDGRTQMERMLTIADKFAQMDDGPKKVALAMELFGKSGKDLIPILNMGSEGLQAMDKVTQDYAAGALFATDANKELRDWLDQVNARGMALADATDTTTIAMQGLGNIMTDAFAPILTSVTEGVNELIKAFIESYREGGIVAVVMGTITTVLEAVWEIVKAVGEIFYEVFSAIIEIVGDVVSDIMDAFGVKTPQAMHAAGAAWNIFKDAVVIAKDMILICIDTIMAMVQALIGDLVTLGKVAYDAMTLNWGSIEGDWAAGMARVRKQVEGTAAKIQGHAKEMQQAMAAAMRGEAMPGKEGEVPRPKQIRDWEPSESGGGHGGHKSKGGSESISQKLDEELEAKKTAWAMEQDAQGTYQQFSLQSEADFWAEALKRTDLSAKDRIAVERKYLAARQELLKEKQAAQMEDAKQSEALAMEAAKNENDLARIGLQEKIAAIDEAHRAGQISAKTALQEKAVINQQMLQLDQDLADKEFQIRLKELQAELSVLGQKEGYYRRIEDQIALLQKQHTDQEIMLNRKKVQAEIADNQKVADAQRKVWDQTFRGFSSNIAQILTGQQTFFQTVQGMWQSLQNIAARAIENIVQNWLVGLAMKESASAAFHAKQVLHDAKQAAAGAWNAVVHIPVVGPILAPIAAAAAFAGVMAFSAEGGMGEVPYDNAPFLLHKQEMVLPANLAVPLRSMLSNVPSSYGAANNNAPAAANDGDSHFHYHDHNGTATPAQIMERRGAIAKAVKQAHREGHFAGFKFK